MKFRGEIAEMCWPCKNTNNTTSDSLCANAFVHNDVIHHFSQQTTKVQNCDLTQDVFPSFATGEKRHLDMWHGLYSTRTL